MRSEKRKKMKEGEYNEQESTMYRMVYKVIFYQQHCIDKYYMREKSSSCC